MGVVKISKERNTYKGSLEPKMTEVLISAIHGKGVRTMESVGRGQFIMDFFGEVISKREREQRQDRLPKNSCLYFFAFGNGVLDAYYFGNEARFLNHS